MIVQFKYKNWRGEIAYRKVKPIKIYFGSTEYHKTPSWLLKAFNI